MEQRIVALDDFVAEDGQPALEAASYSVYYHRDLDRGFDTQRAFDVAFDSELALMNVMVG
jgi:hypothetical protein